MTMPKPYAPDHPKHDRDGAQVKIRDRVDCRVGIEKDKDWKKERVRMAIRGRVLSYLLANDRTDDARKFGRETLAMADGREIKKAAKALGLKLVER